MPHQKTQVGGIWKDLEKGHPTAAENEAAAAAADAENADLITGSAQDGSLDQGQNREEQKSKRTGRHSSRGRMKITDSSWEQSFLISYLPQFVEARKEYYGEEIDRLGNYVGVYGDQGKIMKLLVDATKMDSWAQMNSAQASALVPHISFTKVATPELMAIDADAPQEVPIQFGVGLNLEAIMGDSSAATGGRAIGGAGIKDVSITRKFGKTGPKTDPRCAVSVTFGFDSMETFTRNQRQGMNFLDLIPTTSAKMRTKGKKDTLWNLRMTYGWEEPVDATGAVFKGPAGQRILSTIGKTRISLGLMYAGKHDITLQDDGSVELNIDYHTSTESLQGDESRMRSNILGKPVGTSSDVKEYEEAREKLLEKLRATKAGQFDEELAAAQDSAKQAEQDAEESLRGRSQALALAMGVTPGPEMDQSVRAFLADVDILKGGEDDPDAGEPTEAQMAEYYALKAERADALKAAREEHQTSLETFRNQLAQEQLHIAKIHEDLKALDDRNQRAKELRYSSLIEQLFRTERLYALDISAKDLSNHSSKYRGRQHIRFKKFRDEELKAKLAGAGTRPAPPTTQDEISKWHDDLFKQMTERDMLDRNPAAAAGKDAMRGADVRSKRIYYFYLGDLMDIIMTNFYGHAASDIGGDDPSQKGSRFQSTSLLLGDFNYNTYKNDTKPRTVTEEHIRSTAYHMGDFPIALSSFLKWFTERFIKIGYTSIPLEHFLSEFANSFFGSPVFTQVPKNSWGPMLNPQMPQQNWDMMFNELVSPIRFERGNSQIMKIKNFYDVENDEKFEKEKFFTGIGDGGEGGTYTYLTIAPGFDNNMSEPAFTIYMGSSTSLIQSVKYNKASGKKAMKTARIMSQGGGQGNIKFGPAAAYTVDVELFGAPYFVPGLCFELNNNVFGMATLTADGESLTDILPRILNVTEVVHKIAPNTFTTSLKCRPAGLSIREFVDSKGDVKATFGVNRPGMRI